VGKLTLRYTHIYPNQGQYTKEVACFCFNTKEMCICAKPWGKIEISQFDYYTVGWLHCSPSAIYIWKVNDLAVYVLYVYIVFSEMATTTTWRTIIVFQIPTWVNLWAKCLNRIPALDRWICVLGWIGKLESHPPLGVPNKNFNYYKYNSYVTSIILCLVRNKSLPKKLSTFF